MDVETSERLMKGMQALWRLWGVKTSICKYGRASQLRYSSAYLDVWERNMGLLGKKDSTSSWNGFPKTGIGTEKTGWNFSISALNVQSISCQEVRASCGLIPSKSRFWQLCMQQLITSNQLLEEVEPQNFLESFPFNSLSRAS